VLYFDDDVEDQATLQRQDSQDLYAAHGLIRVYAGIWDLEVTYKGLLPAAFPFSFPFLSFSFFLTPSFLHFLIFFFFFLLSFLFKLSSD